MVGTGVHTPSSGVFGADAQVVPAIVRERCLKDCSEVPKSWERAPVLSSPPAAHMCHRGTDSVIRRFRLWVGRFRNGSQVPFRQPPDLPGEDRGLGGGVPGSDFPHEAQALVVSEQVALLTRLFAQVWSVSEHRALGSDRGNAGSTVAASCLAGGTLGPSQRPQHSLGLGRPPVLLPAQEWLGLSMDVETELQKVVMVTEASSAGVGVGM